MPGERRAVQGGRRRRLAYKRRPAGRQRWPGRTRSTASMLPPEPAWQTARRLQGTGSSRGRLKAGALDSRAGPQAGRIECRARKGLLPADAL